MCCKEIKSDTYSWLSYKVVNTDPHLLAKVPSKVSCTNEAKESVLH